MADSCAAWRRLCRCLTLRKAAGRVHAERLAFARGQGADHRPVARARERRGAACCVGCCADPLEPTVSRQTTWHARSLSAASRAGSPPTRRTVTACRALMLAAKFTDTDSKNAPTGHLTLLPVGGLQRRTSTLKPAVFIMSPARWAGSSSRRCWWRT